jgi:hypothetical protein
LPILTEHFPRMALISQEIYLIFNFLGNLNASQNQTWSEAQS